MSSTASYKKAVGGALKFKGGLSLKKKKSKKKKTRANDDDNAAGVVEKEESGYSLTKIRGTGRVHTSGTSVTGHDTKFVEELSIGDAFIVKHPTTFKEETRIVRMVLSNMSISISSPFSTDLISTTEFSYIKAPPQEVDEEEEKAKAKKRKRDDEQLAFGTYMSDSKGQELVYRTRKAGAYGGYQIVKERLDIGLSREELLDRRSKKKADRLCM